jgi:ribosome-binding factor A
MTALQRAVHNTADCQTNVTEVLHADLHYVAVWRSTDTQQASNKRLLASLSVRSSVLKEQLGSRWADFDKI